MAEIVILYFAGARTSLPGEPYQETVILPNTPFYLSSLRALLIARYEGNRAFAEVIERSAWSVEEEIIEREIESELELKGGETVGIIPGVSGG